MCYYGQQIYLVHSFQSWYIASNLGDSVYTDPWQRHIEIDWHFIKKNLTNE
jgi:hypothetical protein